MDVDLRLLGYAVVLSRHRHFGRAAVSLKISQPTLSRSIATLERQLGVRLFERSKRDVSATPAGHEVLQMAGELVSRAEAMSHKVQLVRDGAGGRVRVVMGAYMLDLAGDAIIELIRARPKLQLEIVEREWAAALDMLAADRVDFAVLDVGAVKDMPSFRVESLGRLKGTFFCRTGHPLTRQAVVTAEDLRKYSFVSTGLAGRHSAWIAEIDPGFTPELASANVALPAIAVSSFSFIYRIVEATDAIGVAHVSQLQAAVAQGRFALLKSVAKLPTVEFGIACKRDRTLSPSARALAGLLRTRMRRNQAVQIPH